MQNDRVMTREQKKLLEPFGIVLAGMEASLREMTTQELLELRDACDAVSPTNCWCFSHQAAEVIRPELDRMLRRENERILRKGGSGK